MFGPNLRKVVIEIYLNGPLMGYLHAVVCDQVGISSSEVSGEMGDQENGCSSSEVSGEMGDQEKGCETLVEAALRVLNTPDPFEKARLGDYVASQWLNGSISVAYHPSLHFTLPDRPARLTDVKLVAPGLMPKLGRAGSLQSRQAIVHSLTHTESWAIDLSWDIIARFGKQEAMPREFFTDFVKVAQDEGRHFTLLAKRLEELGSYYGALPAHDGLWDSATATAKDLLARLAIEHCVHEARGLDVLPTTISRFRCGGDNDTANLLEGIIYPEEITHCAAGVRWFKYLCLRSRNGDSLLTQCEKEEEETEKEETEVVIQKFQATVRTYFRGPLKPPFNEEARNAAGFGPQWYQPLAIKETCSAKGFQEKED